MKKLLGVLIPLCFVMVTGCAHFHSKEELCAPVYLPNEKAKLVSFYHGQEPGGFNEIKWETSVSTLEGMKPYRKDSSYGGIDFYLKEKDAFKLGNGRLHTIQYGFWKGRFYTGVITTEGLADFNALKEGVFGKYGLGAKPFRNKDEFLWVGKDAVMALRYDEVSKCGLFYIRSDAMAKQMNKIALRP
jgi:hypothetical protein